MSKEPEPLVAVIIGSKSDWETIVHATQVLERLLIPYECRVLSAHRTPAETAEYVSAAASRGLEVIIAGAGGAAHLAGAAAAHTLLPVIGVPMAGSPLGGFDALLSTVQMPAGIPVATMAIGQAGAVNAALFAAAILAGSRPELRERLKQYREEQARKVLSTTLP